MRKHITAILLNIRSVYFLGVWFKNVDSSHWSLFQLLNNPICLMFSNNAASPPVLWYYLVWDPKMLIAVFISRDKLNWIGFASSLLQCPLFAVSSPILLSYQYPNIPTVISSVTVTKAKECAQRQTERTYLGVYSKCNAVPFRTYCARALVIAPDMVT